MEFRCSWKWSIILRLGSLPFELPIFELSSLTREKKLYMSSQMRWRRKKNYRLTVRFQSRNIKKSKRIKEAETHGMPVKRSDISMRKKIVEENRLDKKRWDENWSSIYVVNFMYCVEFETVYQWRTSTSEPLTTSFIDRIKIQNPLQKCDVIYRRLYNTNVPILFPKSVFKIY